MSDRTLILSGCVPLALGLLALVLLARVPPVEVAAADARAIEAVPATTTATQQDGWVGVVVASSTAELAADASGRVAEVFAKTGDHVVAGDKLLRFDASDASNAVRMARAQLRERGAALRRSEARARAAHKRLGRLRAGEAWLSRQELDQAVEDAKAADAEVEAANDNLGVGRAALRGQHLRRDRRLLRAPFAGQVVAVSADVGDSVVEGQIVLRILSNGRQVRFAFPPGELPSREAVDVAIHLERSDATVVAPVDSVRPALDPAAEMVFATAPLPESLRHSTLWIPGAPVSVQPAGAP